MGRAINRISTERMRRRSPNGEESDISVLIARLTARSIRSPARRPGRSSRSPPDENAGAERADRKSRAGALARALPWWRRNPQRRQKVETIARELETQLTGRNRQPGDSIQE